MRRMERWALAAALAAGVTSCGSAAGSAWTARDVALTDDGIVLEVRNNSRADMNVFVIDGGTWRGIGFVEPTSTARFDVAGLNRSGAALRILATTVVGQGSARVGPLTVRPGQVVTFTIEADLVRSFATVHLPEPTHD